MLTGTALHELPHQAPTVKAQVWVTVPFSLRFSHQGYSALNTFVQARSSTEQIIIIKKLNQIFHTKYLAPCPIP